MVCAVYFAMFMYYENPENRVEMPVLPIAVPVVVAITA